MSGGKETGRQKMVGMMYLVLTALLALNVSNTIIDKFVFINESLVSANNETQDRNIQIMESIVKTVDETGNREADLKVMEAAKLVHEKTDVLMTKMVQLKDTMVAITGGYIEYEPSYVGDAKHLAGKTDYSKVGHYMMPIEEGGQGKGQEVKDMLNGYAEDIKGIMSEFGAPESEVLKFKPIAVDAVDDPVYNKDPNQAGKAFAQLAFSDSPTPACLATVADFQSKILSYETRAMAFLSSKVGAGDIAFDQIVAMVRPESKYVAAGTPYKAEMFIAASASAIVPTMTYNGKPIKVQGGVGLVEFTASAKFSGKEMQKRQTFEAAITIDLPGGGDTTYASIEEYFVMKPVIQIQSASVGALYFNCGNKLDVQVPALGTTYNPRFSAKGGSTIKGATAGAVTIVPSAKEVVLSVSSNGNRIGSRTFGVRPIPAVEIKAFSDRGEVDISKGIPAKTPRLSIRAIPDAGFKEFLPDDAKFQVSQIVATLVSGGVGRQSVKGSGSLNLSAIASSARKGDILVLEFKQVKRKNFKGDIENFNAYNRSMSIPLK
ncbi:MAG: gliding motility protein GldM [Flammeovirgaceae bacterium]|nr:gliding motility protein GldM [Flammeovirgaceae bacterium]|tara:strand:+ start:1966 stop:3606 length:1641 start_codon:yes stop_codon:yes gene_type:complete